MVETATSGSKLLMDGKSTCRGNTRNLKEVTVRRKKFSEEEVFFRVMRDVQGLDIILSLQTVGCYTLPYRSTFRAINFTRLLQKLAGRKITFQELVTQRTFKKLFGPYGYKILNICFRISLDELVSENRYLENID